MPEPQPPRQDRAPDGMPPRPGHGLKTIQEMAETVGFVPDVRKRHNLIQGLVVALGTALGAVLGYALHERIALAVTFPVGGYETTLLGALVGLVVSGFLSGLVLMVLGAARRRNRTKTP